MNEPSVSPVEALLVEYERLALSWDASQHDAKIANRHFVDLHQLALLLRQSSEGRSGLEQLIGHENRGVRLAAAADSLQWGSKVGIRALSALKASKGSHSFTAEMTLREYRAGRTNFDW